MHRSIPYCNQLIAKNNKATTTTTTLTTTKRMANTQKLTPATALRRERERERERARNRSSVILNINNAKLSSIQSRRGINKGWEDGRGKGEKQLFGKSRLLSLSSFYVQPGKIIVFVMFPRRTV